MPGNSKKRSSASWKKGQSGNPQGRPPLPPEIKVMRDAVLSKAVKVLKAKINDARYINKLNPSALVDFLSMAFDRCGLPKVTQLDSGEGLPLKFTLRLGTPLQGGGGDE